MSNLNNKNLNKNIWLGITKPIYIVIYKFYKYPINEIKLRPFRVNPYA